MAEEKETTQKPKVELIKKAPVEQESADVKSVPVPAPEHGEKRKVIILKKKPVVTAVKKAVPKVVASRPAEAPPGENSSESSALSPQAETLNKAPDADAVNRTGEVRQAVPPAPEAAAVSPAENAASAEKPDAAAAAETSPPTASAQAQTEGREAENQPSSPPQPEKKTPPQSGGVFQESKRPASVAGKVGGKYVGVRPSPSFQQRPQGAAGRVGGRPVGPPRNDGGPRPGGRPFGGPQGGPRPDYQRPGGSGGPGNRQGFRPRPDGSPGFGPRRGPPGGPGRPGPGRPGPGGRPGGQTPSPVIESGKGPAKKTFKAKKPVYTRKDKEQEMGVKLLQTKKKISQVANPVPKSIEIMEVISVSELAKKMNLKASDLIQKLMTMGMMVTINQQIDAETASILASEFGADVKIISLYDETLIATVSDEGAVMLPRPPVVTVMGHVDHGKTKLLDAIRSANVVSWEFGGITQHIGAYIVETPHGRITFLDTPGHEAFTRMRARGAQVTDIVVLVVAADDGVMPQTIEAINHAKEAQVPIIVAVNKIDKPEANPDRVKTQLSEHQLIPEAWGGQTMFVEVSALKKEGIDKLIETILLQAEILDLKANFTCPAEGKVLESRIDHGRGIVATAIIERGTLSVGDSFVAGVWPGKVRALFTDTGERVDRATPSMPVEILGFEGVPNAGDPMQMVEDEKQARQISSKRQELKRFEDAKNIRKITMDNLHDMISDGAIQELKVIIKADVQGSAEALKSSLEKLSTREIRLHVIQALPGAINEGDVDLAIASNAIIIGFNVRPIPKAKALADQEKVDVRRYNIIYKAVEEIQQAMEGMLKPDTKEEVIASVEVRDTFKTPKFGTIAGCYVLTGTVKRSAGVHVVRDSIEIFTGKLSSLRRFKDDVREVASGYECGIGIEGFDGVQTGDQLEIFEMVEVARKLGASK